MLFCLTKVRSMYMRMSRTICAGTARRQGYIGGCRRKQSLLFFFESCSVASIARVPPSVRRRRASSAKRDARDSPARRRAGRAGRNRTRRAESNSAGQEGIAASRLAAMSALVFAGNGGDSHPEASLVVLPQLLERGEEHLVRILHRPARHAGASAVRWRSLTNWVKGAADRAILTSPAGPRTAFGGSSALDCRDIRRACAGPCCIPCCSRK